MTPILRTRGLTKHYQTQVLAGVDFELGRGEVHALVGENGAGKSTLCRILAGLTSPTSGTMELAAQPYLPRTKAEAERRGVRMVMQELNLIGNLSVAENIFLRHLPHRAGWIKYAELNDRAAELLRRVGLPHLDPRVKVRTLGIGQQQLIEIAAGLSERCEVLILDEPTAALTEAESGHLFEQIALLTDAGAGVIYISHHLEEVCRVAGRITVLRDGAVVATRPAGEWTLPEMVRAMVGRDLASLEERPARPPGAVALQVEGLRRGPAVREVSFDVRRGEVLGFAGLMGSGRTETMRAIFGADTPEAGRILLHGQPVRIRSPRDAVRQGVALLTEDRKQQGLLLPLPVRVNITLAALGQVARRRGWLSPGWERKRATEWVDRLSVRCHSLEQKVAELSGGNQQKVVMAKWLMRDCEVLLFDEPTRGIDVGAKFEIYGLLSELAESGKAIVMVSSDLRELMAICDRIAVMSAGRLVETFARGHWSEDRILSAALSGYT
jgi:ribose transport system ATP-binding protein